jgi:hypothetical protein
MITPSFKLDFTTASLDPRVTFTRSENTATVTNSSGHVVGINADLPRFDYNPITLVCRGLLVEEDRTNLLRQSQTFQTAWTVARSSVSADAITAPDNLMTGDKLVEDTTASNTHFVNQSVALSALVYTYSVYLKAGERTWARVTLLDGAATFGAYFNLSTGAIGALAGGATAAISSVGNGWYRCSITTTTATATATGNARVILATGNNGQTYTGDGTSGIYIWGAQIEAGASATSYIPTTTAAVTRNADVATITGTNFSDFWQASKGGAMVHAIPSTVSGIGPLVQYDDGTADNIIALRGNAANPELQIINGGAPQVQLDAGTIVANTPYSLTGWWQTNDCKARQNSGAVVTDTTATIPTVTQARIGSDGTNYLNGHLATINYYDSFFGQSVYTRRKNKVFASLL